jgi:hypothetical protein
MSNRSIQDCTHFTTMCQYDNLAIEMPKKTKKEKILASLHRKLRQADSASNIVKSQNSTTSNLSRHTVTSSFQYKENSVPKVQTLIFKADYTYVKHDLIRITIFTSMAIIAQGVLYFFLNRG